MEAKMRQSIIIPTVLLAAALLFSCENISAPDDGTLRESSAESEYASGGGEEIILPDFAFPSPDSDGRNIRAYDAGTPTISGITDSTLPGEAVGIIGGGLSGAKLAVINDGKIYQIDPLRSDDTKMQAVIPKKFSDAVSVVFAFNETGVGNPIRLNAPDVYWVFADLCHGEENQSVRFFGSSLSAQNSEPEIYVYDESGNSQKLVVTESDKYHINAVIPNEIAGDNVYFWVSNGTGGGNGWTRTDEIFVREKTERPKEKLETLRLSDFGAVPNDGKSDSEAINSAISAARESGGAVLLFENGEYEISDEIKISGDFPYGLHLLGVGMGEYDFGSTLSSDEYEYKGVSGEYTLLRFASPDRLPKNMISIYSDNVTISGMTIIGGESGGYECRNVFISAENVTVSDMRMIKTDTRDFVKSGSATLMCESNLEIDSGSENIALTGCEFHSKASAIQIGNDNFTWPAACFIASRTIRNVRISNCDIYGYTNVYTKPSGEKLDADEGEISRGITALNVDGLIVENNRFQGSDLKNERYLVRAMMFRLGAQNTYIAGNEIRNVGSAAGSGIHGNKGEQILFHGTGGTNGIFECLEADGNKVTLKVDGIPQTDYKDDKTYPAKSFDSSGSKLIDGLEDAIYGYLYICSGKGIGQVRRVEGYAVVDGTAVFELESPFTITPDATSVVNLFYGANRNIVVGNVIKNDENLYGKGLKTGGVLLFFESYKNIIADNEIANMSFGIALNARFKAPSLWNCVRGNRISGIKEYEKDYAQGGDTTYNAAFLCESVISNLDGWDGYRAWYTVGNAFRSNTCRDGDVAIELTTNRWHRNAGWSSYRGPEKGAAMTIVEDNRFENVADGVLIGNPAYWTLLSDNSFTFSEKSGYPAKKLHNEQLLKNYCVLEIENGDLTTDANSIYEKNKE